MIEPLYVAVLLVPLVGALAVELVGVFRRRRGDTYTELWRHLDARLRGAPQWFYRVFTVGVLIWAALHFAGVW